MRRLFQGLLCIALSLGANGAAAQGYQWAAASKDALQRFDRSAEQLQKARAAAVAFDAGGSPVGSAQEWSAAPGALAAAIEAFQSSDGLLLPEEPTPFPLQQVRSCATRAASLTALGKRQRSLTSTAQRGAEAALLLRNRLAAAAALEEGLKELRSFGTKHPSEPAASALIPAPWPGLEGALGRALPSYTAALRRQHALVEANVGQLRTLAAETGALLAAWSDRGADCALAGAWSGTLNNAGSISGVGVQLSWSGEAWSGMVSINGASIPIATVRLNGSSVSVSLRDGRGTLAGALSPDGRLSGTFSSADGPAAFDLRKSR